MKKSITSILTLVVICLVMAVLLAVTNHFTAPIIADQLAAQSGAALGALIPEGVIATEVTDPAELEKLPKTVTKAYTCSNGWKVLELTTKGYGDGLVFLCAVDGEGAVQKIQHVSDSETTGYGGVQLENGTIYSLFMGITTDTLAGVDTATGATITAKAVYAAINDAINAAAILGGEEVDTRTPEEIFRDNLNAALPAGEGKFTKLFITEVIEGIDAVYTADNGKGYVFIIGEEFIPVDETGVTDNATVQAAYNVLSASSVTDIDLTPYGDALKYVVSAKITATGNYIFEVKGNGYGIMGGDDYHPASGEYIIVRVSMTAEGKIIDTFTVSQAETTGVGDACADEKFYGQFDGKTESNYKEIDAIGGATLTTNGYLKAIERAFGALNTLKGGND